MKKSALLKSAFMHCMVLLLWSGFVHSQTVAFRSKIDNLNEVLEKVDGSYLVMNEVYTELGQLMLDEGHYQDLLDLSLNLQSRPIPAAGHMLQSAIYGSISASYLGVGVVDSALYYSIQHNLFLDDLEKKPNLNRYAMINERLVALRLLAKGYGYKGNVDLCLRTLNQAVKLIEGIDPEQAKRSFPNFRYGHVYLLLGFVHQSLGEYPESQVAFMQYGKEAKALGDERAMAEAQYLSAQEMSNRANSNPQLVISALSEIEVSSLSTAGAITSGMVYDLMANTYSRIGNYDSVRAYADKAAIEILQTDDYARIASMYWTNVSRARMYQDWEWAYANYEQMAIYDMMVLRSTNERNIGRLENELKNKAAQDALSHELKSQRTKKNMISGGAIVLLLINIFVVRSLRLSRKASALEHIENEKLAADRKVGELKKERLNSILEFKNRQLATTTLSTERLNSQMNLMVEKLEMLKQKSDSDETVKSIDALLRELKTANNLQDNWAKFYKHFEGVHPNFFNKLIEINAELTQNELRHCAYVLMNLSNKEVAHMYNISPNSVKTARTRLKRKLGIAPEASLTDFIHELSDTPGGQFLKQA